MGSRVRVSVDEGLGRPLERYMKLYESPENRRLTLFPDTSWSLLPESPLLVEVRRARLRDTHLDPEAFVTFTIAQRIYRFERWRDCTPLTLDIAYWSGVVLEEAALGMEPVYPEDQDPWILREALVTKAEDIDSLCAGFDPDRGILRLMLEMSEFFRVKLPGIAVPIQAWDRSALGIAISLMGVEGFLIVTSGGTVLVHPLLRRLTDEGPLLSAARQAYLERLGFPVESAICPGLPEAIKDMNSNFVNIISDELGLTMLPPAVYKEFVFPCEAELVEEPGRLNYYHSYSFLTTFLPSVARLRPLTQHVGAWTDWEVALWKYVGSRTLLQQTLHSMRDVLDRDLVGMKDLIRSIRAAAACMA